jgi:imidazolonepropionase-like amidohydrolase
MKIFRTELIALCCLLLPCFNLFAQNTEDSSEDSFVIIQAGTLLAHPGSPPRQNVSLLIRNDKIESLKDGFLSPAQFEVGEKDVRVINLQDKFVLPGLIDAHVHLMFTYGAKFRDPLKSGEETLVSGIINAKSTINAGFTTVADLDAGANSWPVIVLRNAINSGDIAGPRILAAGSSISPTGGHGDFLDAPDHIIEQFSSSGLCDGEAECRRAVRRQFRQGADLIKLHATGGGAERTGGKHHKPSFMEDEFRGIVEAAHGLDLKVTAHAHSTEGINAALRAGVDSIEHGSFLDKDSIRLFKKNNAYLLPTLDVQDMIVTRIDSVPPHAKSRLELYLNEWPDNFKKAWKAGVKIALGSDAGVVPHGSNAREIEWFVKIGMSEAEAIKTATISTAEHLGMSKKIGKIEAGMSADIIAVSGDPLRDIKLLQHVGFVMKEGKVFKQIVR